MKFPRTTSIRLHGDKRRARALADANIERLLMQFRRLNELGGLQQNMQRVRFFDDLGRPVGTMLLRTFFGTEIVDVESAPVGAVEAVEERKIPETLKKFVVTLWWENMGQGVYGPQDDVPASHNIDIHGISPEEEGDPSIFTPEGWRARAASSPGSPYNLKEPITVACPVFWWVDYDAPVMSEFIVASNTTVGEVEDLCNRTVDTLEGVPGDRYLLQRYSFPDRDAPMRLGEGFYTVAAAMVLDQGVERGEMTRPLDFWVRVDLEFEGSSQRQESRTFKGHFGSCINEWPYSYNYEAADYIYGDKSSDQVQRVLDIDTQNGKVILQENMTPSDETHPLGW